MHPSRMAQTIKAFLVMDVMEKANTLASQGRDIIHLEVGEPDFDTPECVRTGSRNAMQRARPTIPIRWEYRNSGMPLTALSKDLRRQDR